MRLQGKRVGVFVAPEFEDLEFWGPVLRLREEGAQVTVLGISEGPVRGKHGLDAQPDKLAKQASPEDFDALVTPGGWAPDKLRRDAGVLHLVRTCHEQGKILGFICHAGWVAISAGIVRGKGATGSKGIKDDIENAGGTWRDEAAFREGNLVWGRVVEDIPAFCRELVNAIAEG